MKSNLYAEEAHKGDAHQSRQDKGDADAAQRTGNVGIGGETFADSGDGSDCEKPAETPAATCTDCRPDTREIALLHEERTAEDGTVDGDEREEDTERRIERRTVLFDRHFDKLRHRGDDRDKHDEREEAQVDLGILRAEPRQRTGTQDVGLQQVVDRKRHHEHESDRHTQTESRLDVLRHGNE